jgi:hypothetical protein
VSGVTDKSGERSDAGSANRGKARAGAIATKVGFEMSRATRIRTGTPRRAGCLRAVSSGLVCALFLLSAFPVLAGPRESALRMHNRLVGVPPDSTTLDAMEAMIADDDDAAGAADLAMQNPAFYNSTLKTWITPWTNEAQTVFAPLNDYTATVIGIIRDERPFTEVLTGNDIYMGRGGNGNNGVVPAAYSQTTNVHYEQLEEMGVDLSNPVDFVPFPQDALPGSMLDASETAGIMTTRAAGEAFFSAGTNRAMFRYVAINFLCVDLEQLSDTSRPVDRIRQDVTRSPGGDSQIFLNSCAGCHSGMDPLSGAFAYFNWDETQGRVVHTRGDVQLKNLINGSNFPFGYVTVDNRWDNYWREGQNATFGWSDALPGGGYGVKSLGQEIAESRGFARCQVQKVFKQVCFRQPANEFERNQVESIATTFEDEGYNLKSVFGQVAAFCMDE